MDTITQGMTSLMEGNLEDAVNHLLVAYNEHCATWAGTQQESDVPAPQDDASEYQVQSISLQEVVDVEMEYVSIGNEFRLFNCGFIVEGELSVDSPLGKALLSSVIMYNIGVIFHLTGAFPSDTSAQAKALFMYSKVARTLRQYRFQGSRLEELELATYCNMGHVYSLLQDEKGMNLCRDELRMGLERVDSTNIEPETLQFFSEIVSVPCAEGRFDQAPAA